MKFASKYFQRLLLEKKLILICDLDETLLTTVLMEVDVCSTNFKDILYTKLKNHEEIEGYVTMLRPNLNTFLTNVSKIFDLHLMTMGTKPYVNEMLKLIDPKRKLFGNRITTKENFRAGQSKLDKAKEMFANGFEMIYAIDDRVDVWNNSDKVINVEPYCVLDDLRYLVTNTVHRHNKDIINRVLNSISDTDNYLKNLETVLTKIYHDYFEASDKICLSKTNVEVS